jgi:hypothetical protein
MRHILPSTEMSKEVVKDVVSVVVVGRCDIPEGATPTGTMELELVVEVATPEKAATLELEF